MIKRSRAKELDRNHRARGASDALPEATDGAKMVMSVDPHKGDQPTDDIRVMTQRQLTRIVYVAAEAGARFGRQGSVRAVSWMLAPSPLLNGHAPHLACQDQEMFERAMWLHKVAAPLFVTHSEMLELVAERNDPPHMPAAIRCCGTRASLADLGLGKVDLFTATVADENAAGHAHIFAAFLAVDEQEARERLEIRLGASLTSAATISRGFDPSEPIAASLLSDAVSHTLIEIAQEPTSALAAGLDLLVEHRFAE